MKEEAPSSKKMPRKPRAAPTNLAPSTPTKVGGNDEILSSLLRLNNYDSNMKDESLDIDLSACVTISGDSAAMLATTNSLSSTDFWRVLDESAQNAHLELTNASDDVQHQLVCASLSDDGLDDSLADVLSDSGNMYKTKSMDKIYISSACSDAKIVGGVVIKEEKPQPSFSGTFLRPEAPPPTPSPIKRLLMKPLQSEQLRQAERCLPKEKIRRDLKKDMNAIGQSYQLNTTHLDDAAVDNVQSIEFKTNDIKSVPTNHVVVNSNKSISSSSFNIFTIPEVNTKNLSSNSNNIVVATLKRDVAGNSNSSSSTSSNKEPTSQETGNNPEPVFKCLDCDGLILQGRGEFATHEAIGHRIHYRCSVCEQDFEQEATLKKHMKSHRSTDPRKDAWKKCPDCGKCLKLGSMWMHRKIHSDNKKYGCDICGQKFVQKINLTHHSRIHTAEKPYECPECQKRFQERSHLQRHQKYHAQTRSYRCEKCGKMYKTERCLKVHNLVHLEQRPFACTVCEKSFISNSKLKQHSNIHTGERPFKCNYCPRDFTNFPNWLKHTRRRHKVDHKTGEHLENIPSYCSKKSTKTAKAKAVAAAEANSASTESSMTKKAAENDANKLPIVPNETPSEATTTTPKQATKRKKKTSQPSRGPTLPPPQPPPLVAIRDDSPLPTIATSTLSTNCNKNNSTNTNNVMTSIPMSMAQQLKSAVTVVPISKTTNKMETCKTAKPKRERKQHSPKQVPKTIPAPTLLSIKREIIEADVNLKQHANTSLLTDTRSAISGFPDLSITSAEELIMEQALEMEECGFYGAQPSVALDTDNAISSSEATAALHFKIKSEFDPVDLSPTRIKEEEYGVLKDMNQRILCSSLESSPYSSPASIELSSAPSIVPTIQCINIANIENNQTSTSCANTFNTTDLFTLSSQCPKLVTSLNNSLLQQSVPELQHLLPQVSTQLISANSNVLPTTTQALINHFYLNPMTTIGTSLGAQTSTNQKLPSVNTLLFSNSGNSANVNSTISSSISEGRFFHGKSVTAPSAAPVGRPKPT